MGTRSKDFWYRTIGLAIRSVGHGSHQRIKFDERRIHAGLTGLWRALL